jgi:hypothetical protein
MARRRLEGDNLMNTQTWHVSITLADDGSDVTARARLADGHVDVSGLGVVPASLHDTTGESPFALAALRSLEDLSDALSYVADTDRLAGVDQV